MGSNRSLPLLLGVVIMTGVAKDGHGRGFCNVDHLGSNELQQQVASAGAQFYEAGGSLMLMLAAVERGNEESAREHGSGARDRLFSASEAYQTATEFVDDELRASVREGIDPGAAAELSQVPLDDKTIGDLLALAEAGEVEGLISFCGEQSEAVAEQIDSFITYLDETERSERQEMPVVALLRALNTAVFYGRFISAVFAVAGGERP